MCSQADCEGPLVHGRVLALRRAQQAAKVLVELVRNLEGFVVQRLEQLDADALAKVVREACCVDCLARAAAQVVKGGVGARVDFAQNAVKRLKLDLAVDERLFLHQLQALPVALGQSLAHFQGRALEQLVVRRLGLDFWGGGGGKGGRELGAVMDGNVVGATPGCKARPGNSRIISWTCSMKLASTTSLPSKRVSRVDKRKSRRRTISFKNALPLLEMMRSLLRREASKSKRAGSLRFSPIF